MKSKLFLCTSAATSLCSTLWVFLLAALVLRCKLLETGFPVLAKFSPYPSHLNAVDTMLKAFPLLALLALLLVGIGWYCEHSFRDVRPAAIAVALSLLLSALVLALNPGGYVSWFLS